MHSLAARSPRVVQASRPRSPSLARIAPNSAVSGQRRVVSASARCATFETFLPPPASSHDEPLSRSTSSATPSSSSRAVAARPTNLGEIVIPLPAPYTPPQMNTSICTPAPFTPHMIVPISPRLDTSFFHGSPMHFPSSPRSPSMVRNQASPRFSSPRMPSHFRLPTISLLDAPLDRSPRLKTLFDPRRNEKALRKASINRLKTAVLAPTSREPMDAAAAIKITTPQLDANDPKSARLVCPRRRPRFAVAATADSGAYVLRLPLSGYSPDEVTISVVSKDGDEGLRVVADRWGSSWDEKCYLEYHVGFRPGDVLLTGVVASFRDGILRVTVPRPIDD